MREREPMTQTMKISEVKNTLSSLVNKVYRRQTRVLVVKAGIPVAALVSAEDLKRLAQLDEQDRRAWEVLEAMRAPFRGISPEEIQQEADKAIAQVRAQRQAEQARTNEAAASA
jgi:prevent-host-death family protein